MLSVRSFLPSRDSQMNNTIEMLSALDPEQVVKWEIRSLKLFSGHFFQGLSLTYILG